MRKVCACFILGITERSESFQVNCMQVPNSYPSRILFINFLAYYLTFRIPCSKKKFKKKHWMKSKTCLLWSTHRLKGLVIENLWLWNWSKDTKVRTKKYLSQLKEKNSREDSLEKKKVTKQYCLEDILNSDTHVPHLLFLVRLVCLLQRAELIFSNLGTAPKWCFVCCTKLTLFLGWQK